MTPSDQASLFTPPTSPLAERLRPGKLHEFLGQEKLLASDGPLGSLLAARTLSSLVFWGPPGSGKTSLARLIAKELGWAYLSVPAVSAGLSALRAALAKADEQRTGGRSSLLFIDELHRFHRGQQDALLPAVESGRVVLIGATTENPSFALTSALLSRLRVLLLESLDATALAKLLARAQTLVGRQLPLDAAGRSWLISAAQGDGRQLLNLAEALFAASSGEDSFSVEDLPRLLGQRMPLHDRRGDRHYDLLSAFHKSLRGSDADAALYWLARMLVAGEDPRVAARRLLRFAVEDVGLADPQGLIQAETAWRSYERLGTPEGELAIAQATVYLATAPKSNALHRALDAATTKARASGSAAPPMIIRNAPTNLLKEIGAGVGYRYDHDEAGAFSGQNYFPEGLESGAPGSEALGSEALGSEALGSEALGSEALGSEALGSEALGSEALGSGAQGTRPIFYRPSPRGFEKELGRRLATWARLRAKSGAGEGGSESAEVFDGGAER